MSHLNSPCRDCSTPHPTTRREFLKTAAAAGVAASGITALAAEGNLYESETLVQQLFGTLTEQQRKLCAFDFDHKLRTEVDNNWHITEVRIGKDFNPDQQELIREIFMKLHSPDYMETVYRQVEHDGGFRNCAIALFGQPGSGKFEFVLSGRHVTRRCDGDSVEGAAFGGPIFYGHAAEDFYEKADHKGNVYWYQAKRANELFEALDGRQRKVALRTDARDEQGTETVKLRGKASELTGLPVSDMSADQKELARKVMADVLAPFREADRAESLKLVEKNGFDNLCFSYYQNMDIGDDGVWDVWQVEGPAMVWYFRGKPHVHTWVHIRDSV